MKTTDITREEFNEALYAFASTYIFEVRKRIAEQADEAWENEAVRFIVARHAELKAEAVAAEKSEFDSLLEKTWAYNQDGGDIIASLHRREREAYGKVLYELLCK